MSHGYNQKDLENSKKAGAMGYCRKDKNDILNTLASIEQQKDCFNISYLNTWKIKTESQNLHVKDAVEKVHLLTPLDKKILQLSSKGMKAAEMAQFLNLIENTVNQYRSTLLQKLEFSSITSAVAWALATHTIEHSEVFTPPHTLKK